MRARHEAPAALSPTTLADLLVMPVGADTAAAAAAATAVALGAAGHANREAVSTVAPLPLESTKLLEGVADQTPPDGTKAHAWWLEALMAAAAISSLHPAEGDDTACRSVVGSEPAIVMISAAVYAPASAFSPRSRPAGRLRLKHGDGRRGLARIGFSAGLLELA